MLLFIPDRVSSFSNTLNLFYSLVFIFNILFFFNKIRKVDRNWMRLDVLFLIGYIIVHFQIPFLAALNIEPDQPSFIWINKQVVNYATWMSAFAGILWMLGYSHTFHDQIQNKKPLFRSSIKLNLFKYDMILLSIFLLFLGLVGNSLFRGVYDGGGSWGTGANHIFVILRVMLYLRIIYFFSIFQPNSSIKQIFFKIFSYKVFSGVLIMYTLLFLLSGDRGPVLQVGLLSAGAYTIYIRPIGFKRLMLLMFLGAFIFTLLRYGRGRDHTEFENGNIIERGYSSYSASEQGFNVTDELASSVRIQYRALDVVPDRHPYLNGLTFLTMSIGTIPFAGSTVIELFDIPNQYKSSPMFFTFLGQGSFHSYGEGSEILADIYVNFGIYGVFVLMLFFGLFSGNITQKASSLHLNYVIILLFILTYALYMNRGMLLTPLKDVVYALVINYIVFKLKK